MDITSLDYRINLLEKRILKLEEKSCSNVPIPIKKLHPKARIPEYCHDGDAGFDLFALIDNPLGYIVIEPLDQAIIPTGLACAIPIGYEIQVRPKSGLAFKFKITVTNSPGTIDSPYRGEIMVIVYNLSKDKSFSVKHGDKAAQGVLSQVCRAIFEESDELDKTTREAGGFGSTGT